MTTHSPFAFPRAPFGMLLILAPVLLSPVIGFSPQETGPAPDFESLQLSADFTCEGAGYGDLDGDGHMDVIAGPYWYAGPSFEERHRFNDGLIHNPKGYSRNFFIWTWDFSGDGALDILVGPFPGAEAYWYENPGKGRGEWQEHLAFDKVDNESPTFLDLTGDGVPELVFHTRGVLGWAQSNPSRPAEPWTFHPLSEKTKRSHFTHGFGVGDIDGDGRMDVLVKDEWRRQPESLAGDPIWEGHPWPFAPGQGGSQMYAYDIDGDGDNDVITALVAHGFGLVWHEQIAGDKGIAFKKHVIMGEKHADNAYGVRFAELHAIDLIDMNGDGLKDIVSGKRWWSHGAAGDPEPGALAVLYWFELRRTPTGVDWRPHLIHSDSGVGVQVVAGDIDGDGRPDVVVGNKQGTFVHLQRGTTEDVAVAAAKTRVIEFAPEFVVHAKPVAEPAGFPVGVRAKAADGRVLNLDFEAGDLRDWTTEGAAFVGQPMRGDTVSKRRSDMRSGHFGEYWLGGYELLEDKPSGKLRSIAFEASMPWASFFVGGGMDGKLHVDVHLVEGGRLINSTTGVNGERMQPVIVDLRAHVGKQIYIEVVDDHGGHWGHINFDHFRLHAEEPTWPQGYTVNLGMDVVDNDGLSPQAAAEAMALPAGFHAQLIAGEPDVHQPIAFCMDERARLWVVEGHTYPKRQPEGEGKDRVLIFEDEDGDGSYETRKVFTEGLNLVSGIEVGFGGVWIGAAPYLLFIPDADGDDVPDSEPQILLDGWGYQDTHETLNSFIWGPDGWLYGCHGVFTHSKVGKPGTPDDERTGLNAGVWRYHPTRHEFDVFAWGTSNPWGVDFNDDGQVFITACVIPHLWHMIQGGRYHRQGGKHFNSHVYDDIKTIADHSHFIGETPHSGNGRSSTAGGGHAHCGAMIYLGDAFPEEYRNTIFFNNVHGNRVNRDVMERSGSGFTGAHADDWLAANDRWFRGINMRYGPDGSVFLIDWYDQRACHGNDPEVWDRGNGRIYRVSYGDESPALTNLNLLSNKQLVQMQLHENDWFVRGARRLLQQRGGTAHTRRGLMQILVGHEDPRRKLRALWSLHVTDALDESTLLATLASEHEYLRAWAIQLLCESGAPSNVAQSVFLSMAQSDPSPVVRLYLSSALQRLPLERRWDLAESLLQHGEDAQDHNLPLMYWYGVEPLVPHDTARALAMAGRSQMPLVTEYIWRRAAAETEHLDPLIATLGKLEGAPLLNALDQVWKALERRRGLQMPGTWSGVYEQLSANADETVRERALGLAAVFGDERVFPELRAILADRSAGESQRAFALDALQRDKQSATAEVLQGLLDDTSFRERAIKALARYDHPATARAVLGHFSALNAQERADAIATLASRASYAKEMLGAVGSGKIARSQLSAVTLRQLGALEDSEVDRLVESVWGVFRNTSEDSIATIAAWEAKLSKERLAAADLSFGRNVYSRTCERCHTLFGSGTDLGPDITGANRSDLHYLLENVVDPNAIIPLEYRMTIVRTSDGAIVSGILVEETADAVTLRTENDTVVLARAEIDAMRPDEISMMPVGQLETLSEEEAVALFAYLQSEQQVPRLLTAGEEDLFFDGQSLAGWYGDGTLWSVIDGEIVGKTVAGLNHNEFLKSEYILGDFRLVLETKLTPPGANSGIQFRSTPADKGEVRGYQADMGKGWWGMLYEELGRGTLWGESASDHVKPGEWNVYEILAVGDHIQTALNGNKCVDLHDPDGARAGIVALQIHSGGPLEVRFRKLQLEIDPEPVLKTVK